MNRSRALLVLAVILAAAVAQLSGANTAGAVGGVLSNNNQLYYYDGSAVAWADFNQDGNLDLFTTPGGTMPGLPPTGSATSLFHGNGTTSFTLPPDTGFANLTHGSAAWGDYNNDGWPDIAVLGLQDGSTPVAKVYRNNGNGSFSEDTSAGLPGLYYGSIAWGDYNDDGHQDLLLAGKDASSHTHLLVYTNNGDGTFTNDSDAGLVTDASVFPGVSNGSAVWGDYNNDGYPDILVTGGTGITANPRVTKLFENDQDGTFTEDTAAEVNLTPLENSSAAFGDYNNDGRLDILVAGCDSSSSGVCAGVVSKIYTNQGLNSGVEKAFTQDVPTATLWGFQNGGAAWGDYTNDGNLDLALSGDDASSSPRFTKAYAGNGSGGFTADANSLTPVDQGGLAFGDYNNDSKLDLVAAGQYSTRLIDNYGTSASDAAPVAPTSPTVSYTSYSATFSWGAASDDHTPQAALTYNLCVGTTAGSCDVVSALSNLSTGKRLVPQAGNVGQALTYTLNLTPGRHYYWRGDRY